jgi:hypothetical protein
VSGLTIKDFNSTSKKGDPQAWLMVANAMTSHAQKNKELSNGPDLSNVADRFECKEAGYLALSITVDCLEVDNEACYIFCQGSALKIKLKYIDTRQEWVKTLRNRDIMRPQHVPSPDNIADLFTKILPGPDFLRLRDTIMHPYRP